MNRTQGTLAGLLAFQLLLILLVRSPFASATARAEPRPLLGGMQDAELDVNRVELSGREGQELTLVRSNGSWTIEQMGGFPADSSKVEGLLDDLRELTVRRPVVSSARHHPAFKVGDEENEGRVRIFDPSAGDPRADLILGTSPNYRLLHVRRAGEDEVFETRGLSSYDVRPESSSWIDKTCVDVDESAIVGLRVSNSNGTFQLRRVEGVWQLVAPAELADGELNVGAVEALVRGTGSLSFADGVGAVDESAHGFLEGAAVVTLQVERVLEGAEPAAPEIEEIVLRVGAQLEDQDTKRYLTRDGFSFTGTVWDSSVKELVEKEAGQLLATAEGDG